METVWLYSYDEKKSGYHFVRWGKSSKEKISHHFDYSIMKLWKSLHFYYLQKNGITRLKTTNYIDDNPLHPDLSVNILHSVLYTFPPPPQKSVTFLKGSKPEIVHLTTLFTIPDWRRAAQSFASPHGRAPHIGDWAPLVDVSVSWPKAQMKSPGQTRQAEDPVSRNKKNSDLREIHILVISSNCDLISYRCVSNGRQYIFCGKSFQGIHVLKCLTKDVVKNVTYPRSSTTVLVNKTKIKLDSFSLGLFI